MRESNGSGDDGEGMKMTKPFLYSVFISLPLGPTQLDNLLHQNQQEREAIEKVSLQDRNYNLL